jgi:hypothetical protein
MSRVRGLVGASLGLEEILAPIFFKTEKMTIDLEPNEHTSVKDIKKDSLFLI